MTDTTNARSAAKTEVGLVLQGGGALGAYEWGGILALFDLMDQATNEGRETVLKAVTGVSIGAINAACVVGADDRADARQRLSALWNDLMVAAPSFLPSGLSREYALLGVPNFYGFRSDLLTMPNWTYLYDTHPLLRTLSQRVNFVALNASKTAFVITAVDVESGELTRFVNQNVGDTERTMIEPHHVLASGSLPPQFAWTDISDGTGKVRHYWDGGVIDNTPLGDAIDAFSPAPGINRVLVIMNLFPQSAKLPRSFSEVNERVDQLRFGNRLRQDSETARKINDLITTIEDLAALAPGQLPPRLLAKVNAASAYKFVEVVEVSLTSDDVSDKEYGFRDFSRQGIEARRDKGCDIALSKLRPFFISQPAA